MFKAIRFGFSTLASCVAGVALATSATFATTIPLMAPGLPPGATTNAHVLSMTDEKWLGLIRQHTDFSCGAASLATLLTYAYGLPMSERGVMQAMLDVSDRRTIEQRGFSLLEMKAFLSSVGLRGVGYHVDPTMLTQLKVPTIALLEIDGYAHFVVVRSAVGAYVFIADPARGNLTLSRTEFAHGWNGIAFVVEAPEYRQDTGLRDVRFPASARRLIAGTAPAFDPVSDGLLMSVGSFASYRLP